MQGYQRPVPLPHLCVMLEVSRDVVTRRKSHYAQAPRREKVIDVNPHYGRVAGTFWCLGRTKSHAIKVVEPLVQSVVSLGLNEQPVATGAQGHARVEKQPGFGRLRWRRS